jgi:hypothetical protein
MINKVTGLITLIIILISIVATTSFGCNKDNKVMNGTDNTTMATPNIPPIDTLATVKIETATFALG